MVFGNEKWLESRIAELERGAEIIQTTRGPVEFKRQDSPLYLLIFHGTPGGYDQNVDIDPFMDAGFVYITPYRKTHICNIVKDRSK